MSQNTEEREWIEFAGNRALFIDLLVENSRKKELERK